MKSFKVFAEAYVHCSKSGMPRTRPQPFYAVCPRDLQHMRDNGVLIAAIHTVHRGKPQDFEVADLSEFVREVHRLAGHPEYLITGYSVYNLTGDGQ